MQMWNRYIVHCTRLNYKYDITIYIAFSLFLKETILNTRQGCVCMGLLEVHQHVTDKDKQRLEDYNCYSKVSRLEKTA